MEYCTTRDCSIQFIKGEIPLNSVCIAEQPLEIKEWQGQRVITLKDVDRVHQRPNGTASRNFKSNRKHFISNVDYFQITRRDFGTKFVPNSKLEGNPNLTVILLTESGYLMLAKSLTDDLAWDVQRALVNNYFRGRQPVQQQLPMDAPMPVRKTFRGVPVMTTGDFDRVTNDNIGSHLTHNCRVNWMEPPMAATGMILKEFRNENRHTRVAAAGKLYLLYENDVRRLMHHFHLTADEAFLSEYFGTEPKKETVTVLPSNDDMRFAVRQADLLFSIAKEIKDPFIKEMNLKAVSALLVNVGLWSQEDGTLTVSMMDSALSDAREKYPRP